MKSNCRIRQEIIHITQEDNSIKKSKIIYFEMANTTNPSQDNKDWDFVDYCVSNTKYMERKAFKDQEFKLVANKKTNIKYYQIKQEEE